MGTTSFTQLDVYRKAHQLTLEIYRITEKFPSSQRFGLVSQMQRAAHSIPSSIAEGYGRRTPSDKARFYTISFSSTEELKCFLGLTKDLGYRAHEPALDQLVEDVSRMLRKLINRTLHPFDGGSRRG